MCIIAVARYRPSIIDGESIDMNMQITKPERAKPDRTKWATAKRVLPTFALAAIATCAASHADAAVWAWGCKGKMGASQVIFNRDKLVVLAGKGTKLLLKDIIRRENPVEDDADAIRFNPADFNSGLQQTMEFTTQDQPEKKLTLTEKSSRQTSAHDGRAGPRDESWVTWKKVYRYALEGETPRDVALECMEYMLSTKGGRG
jgi:hypothetical protein